MSLAGKLSRGVSHFVSVTGLTVALGGLAVSGAYIILASLADTYEETPFIRSIQCTIGVHRSDCPQRDRLKGEVEELKAQKRALQAQLDAIRGIQDGNNSYMVFTEYDEHPSGLVVQVSTEYQSLVPPDPEPRYGCYIRLEDGEAGESRALWIKQVGGELQSSRSSRELAGISNSLWKYAQRVCKPTLIGDQ